jgi:hypothetical protein
MINANDLMNDGFLLLSKMDIVEIEQRIEWLNNSLHAYKTLLIVRQLQENKPNKLVVPFEEQRKVEKSEARPGTCKHAIVEILTRHERCTLPELKELTGIKEATISSCLYSGKDVTFKRGNGGYWSLMEGGVHESNGHAEESY